MLDDVEWDVCIVVVEGGAAGWLFPVYGLHVVEFEAGGFVGECASDVLGERGGIEGIMRCF